jgi:hypothetical protein
MTVFPRFQAANPDLQFGKPISKKGAELIRSYSSEKHETKQYLEFLKEAGLCSIKKGLFWLIDPVDYVADLELFGIHDAAPFARTSFGAIYFSTKEAIFILPSVYDWYTGGFPRFDLLFESTLIQTKTLEKSLWLSMHNASTERLGALKENEVFGFEPALALGGNDENLESIKKFEIHSHLALLSQLVTVQRR